MLNYIRDNALLLKKKHYWTYSKVPDYWFQFSSGPLERYKRATNGHFCLVVYRKDTDYDDFYALPFEQVADLFTQESMYKQPQKRWVGTIVENKLRIRNAPDTLDVARYHNNRDVLEGELLDPKFVQQIILDLESIREQEADYLPEKLLREGTRKSRWVSHYERDPRIRAQSIQIHGTTCMICGFNFEEIYGEHGKGFIEVHHLKPLSSQEAPVIVNPRTDMAVVCSNCHRMIHRRKGNVLTLDALRKITSIPKIVK